MEDFLEFWLEDIMRPEMTDPSYVAYRNAIVKHINPHLGNTKLIKLDNNEYVNGICSGQEDDFCQSGRRE